MHVKFLSKFLSFLNRKWRFLSFFFPHFYTKLSRALSQSLRTGMSLALPQLFCKQFPCLGTVPSVSCFRTYMQISISCFGVVHSGTLLSNICVQLFDTLVIFQYIHVHVPATWKLYAITRAPKVLMALRLLYTFRSVIFLKFGFLG